MGLLQKCIYVKPLLSNGYHNLKHTVFICQGYICIRYDITLLIIGVILLNRLLTANIILYFTKIRYAIIGRNYNMNHKLVE
jgi:hypothetical protein